MALIVAADNLTAANPGVALALKNLEPRPLKDLARRCEQAGATMLDLNPGYLSPRFEDRITFLVEAVQEATKLRLILDSPSARVLARGLKACRQPPILNACTLEEEKLRDIMPLAASHGLDLVLLLLDANSFPAVTLEGKVTLALELRHQALDAGIDSTRLIFDPVLPNLSWPDAWRQAGGQDRAPPGQRRGLPGGGQDHGGALQPPERPAPNLSRPNRRGLPLSAGRGRPPVGAGGRAAA